MAGRNAENVHSNIDGDEEVIFVDNTNAASLLSPNMRFQAILKSRNGATPARERCPAAMLPASVGRVASASRYEDLSHLLMSPIFDHGKSEDLERCAALEEECHVLKLQYTEFQERIKTCLLEKAGLAKELEAGAVLLKTLTETGVVHKENFVTPTSGDEAQAAMAQWIKAGTAILSMLRQPGAAILLPPTAPTATRPIRSARRKASYDSDEDFDPEEEWVPTVKRTRRNSVYKTPAVHIHARAAPFEVRSVEAQIAAGALLMNDNDPARALEDLLARALNDYIRRPHTTPEEDKEESKLASEAVHAS